MMMEVAVLVTVVVALFVVLALEVAHDLVAVAEQTRAPVERQDQELSGDSIPLRHLAVRGQQVAAGGVAAIAPEHAGLAADAGEQRREAAIGRDRSGAMAMVTVVMVVIPVPVVFVLTLIVVVAIAVMVAVAVVVAEEAVDRLDDSILVTLFAVAVPVPTARFGPEAPPLGAVLADSTSTAATTTTATRGRGREEPEQTVSLVL